MFLIVRQYFLDIACKSLISSNLLFKSSCCFNDWDAISKCLAALDVFEKGNKINPRLKELDNVFLLPHMSSATIEGRIEMGEKVIVNIKTFVDGHTPPDLILIT